MGLPTTAKMITRINRLMKDMGKRTLINGTASEAIRHWNIRRSVSRVAERSLPSEVRMQLSDCNGGAEFRRFCQRNGLTFTPSRAANGWRVRGLRYRGKWYVRAGCKILPRELALLYWGPKYQAMWNGTPRNKVFAYVAAMPTIAVKPKRRGQS